MKPLRLPQKRNSIFFLMLVALCLLQARVIPAAEPQTVETQLRDRLRAAMLQLRTAETERAAIQAAQAQSADEMKKLTERNEALVKQVNANKQTLQVVESLKSQVDLQKSQIATQAQEIALLKKAIESERQAAELARNKETERAKRAVEVVSELQRLVADRQAKNLALYKIASEILQRYEKFSLGDALTARETFIGIARVKLQNLVQDYQDKLLNERTALNEKDLEPSRDKLLNRPPQTAKPSAKAPSQTSE
jgi:hypothetical protein